MANSEADILVTLRGGRLTAAQISADGVYVVGTDIPGGTWHTSGGQQCYEATLASTDTSNIIDNNLHGAGHGEPGRG